MLFLILLAVPLIGVLFLLFTRDKSIKTPFITSLIVLAVAGYGLRGVFGGEALTYKIAMSGPFKLTFQADALSAIFVLLAAFLWVVVSVYSPKYMEYEGKAWNFQLVTLLTLFTVLGIFLAGNLLTMLLFFELMTISSYFWVIHRRNKEAIRAGYFYLFFSIIGGLLLALGIVMMGGSTDILPMIGTGALTPLNPSLFAWSIVIMLIGFGIKAGMVPLHLWLPYAHSVAPTPGSALLSGLIIKVGAYGLIRTGEFAGWGMKLGAGVTWLGIAIIILGICTMLLGVSAALIQSDAKKLLAYHSISQMGYIILGLGVGLYLGSSGEFGLSGAIYHVINHALFKVALFLGVGVIYIYTGETNLYKLGGLRRRFPVTAILMLFAVLGIAGAPGLNGYASKSLLQHGVSLAAETGILWLSLVKWLFLIVGVGTVASFSKLYYLTFFGDRTELKIKDKRSPKLQISMSILAIVMLGIGIRPDFLLNVAIAPAVQALGIQNITTTLMGFSFWELKDVAGTIITLALGILVCWGGLKTGAFHWQPPVWLTIEGLVGIGRRKTSAIGEIVLQNYVSTISSIKCTIRDQSSRVCLAFQKFDKAKSATFYGINLMGVSADAAILFVMLGFLVASYIFIN